MTEEEYTARVEELETAIRNELIMLWTDLSTEITQARVEKLDPGNERAGWSIAMGNVANRIGMLTPLVGSPGWEQVPVNVLLDGWWRAVHRRMGRPVPEYDVELVQGLRDRQEREAADVAGRPRQS